MAADNDTSAVAVFTGKSLSHIQEVGGSSSWVLDRSHARRCRYLVCCRSGVEWVEGPEPHGSAFLVGLISDVVPSHKNPSRFLIRISHCASVDVPNAWQKWRNPVKYTTLEEMGIDPNSLHFEPMPEAKGDVAEHQELATTATAAGAPNPRGEGLTIADAKRGLAKTFGVREDAVEITIRG